MNKSYDELCQEVTMLRDQLERSQEQGRRLTHRLQETSDMLTEALALGEDSAERYHALKESRPTEIADAVMRARRDWATQADPDYLRERDTRVAAAAMRQVADWMDANSESSGGPTGHEAESIGMEISGPTQCSAADRCYRAGMRAFREAASIWERQAGKDQGGKA
ncbi:hypothetical protein AAGT95_03080 [Salinicola lusitanus]|uniref:Uncharacterized protein n=1 Tax=Salinicola lusitanus TaxID=1949085 RepID=A0ABZ3CUU9_9GAMM